MFDLDLEVREMKTPHDIQFQQPNPSLYHITDFMNVAVHQHAIWVNVFSSRFVFLEVTLEVVGNADEVFGHHIPHVEASHNTTEFLLLRLPDLCSISGFRSERWSSTLSRKSSVISRAEDCKSSLKIFLP